MGKRHLSRRLSNKLNLTLHHIFMRGDGRIDGDISHVADAVRLELARRGESIFTYMGKDPATIIREAENEWLRKRFRDMDYPIDGLAQRIFHYDGHGWLHMPIRLWLNTRSPNAPDATLRRQQVDLEIKGIIDQIPPMTRSLRGKKQAWEKTRANVRAGAEYQQPQLMTGDDAQGAA